MCFACLVSVEKKKETITESAGRQQKKKIGEKPVTRLAKLEQKTEKLNMKKSVLLYNQPLCSLMNNLRLNILQKDKKRN